MTIKQALRSFDLPVRENRSLLKAILHYSDTDLLLREMRELTPTEQKRFERLAQERKTGRPLAYVLGRQAFYGHTFLVNEHVLIPRPETEALVEMALAEHPARVLDLCTGCGAVGISIQKAINAPVVATDISEQALIVARRNADRLRATVQFIRSDLFDAVQGAFDVIVSNPPYIDSTELLTLEVSRYEPRLALDAGEKGMDYYKRIIPQALEHLTDGGVLLLEIGYDQGEAVQALLQSHGYEQIRIHKDFAGFERIARAVRRKYVR